MVSVKRVWMVNGKTLKQTLDEIRADKMTTAKIFKKAPKVLKYAIRHALNSL